MKVKENHIFSVTKNNNPNSKDIFMISVTECGRYYKHNEYFCPGDPGQVFCIEEITEEEFMEYKKNDE